MSESVRLIRDGIVLSPSIDEFLELHSHDAEVQAVGKAAIARAILSAERNSKLYVTGKNLDTAINMRAISDTWYVALMRMLSVGVPKSQVTSIANSVSFVVFNYDRCLEHFFFHAIQQLYSINTDEAKDIVKSMHIFHPYGTIGGLDTLDDDGGTTFGGLKLENDDYVKIGDSINTFAEACSEHVYSNVQAHLTTAQCVVFLGFGYHRANMRLLAPEQPISQIPILATAYKMSESNTESIRDELSGFCKSISRISGNSNPFMYVDNKFKCGEFLSAYSRTIEGR